MLEKMFCNLKEIIKKEKKFIIGYLFLIIILYFLFRPSFIIGPSMENTFFNRDIVVLEKLSYILDEPKYGDVVIAKTNLIYKKFFRKKVIKRIIAKEGDHIEIYNGNVFLNGIKLEEPYLKENYTNGDIDLIVPDGKYFVMGDNRLVSNDSRFSIGLIDKKDLLGRVYLRLWPINRFGSVY